MAQIKVLSWNIQVYGPRKYGWSGNNLALARFAASVAQVCGAHVLLVQEAMASVAASVAYTLCECLAVQTGSPWSHVVVDCAPDGDREATLILWRTDASFAYLQSTTATNRFPQWFGNATIKGRRLGMALFRTTDTGTHFVAGTYHAPPSNPVPGIEACAKCPEIWTQAVGGTAQPIARHVISGDFNLDYNAYAADYGWLTNPRPPAPPPTAKGQGAGLVPAVTDRRVIGTILGTVDMAKKAWGADPANWSDDTEAYRQRDQILDNVFHDGGAAGAGSVVDVLAMMLERRSPVRVYANKFALRESPYTDVPAFPNAGLIPVDDRLKSAAYAFILYRGAVSDHLPIMATVKF
ncbi:hypothetical protein AQ916_15245 [Burkholderia pseudomallei]|uniref:endonuclease/exonuclease/phosphatase family protein n=1 Tax=Burkholderia pseudomallei TaxID=28450 RepID=UPI0009770370|nr:endonuclease/exonuclease/phosphatase family protein [Burkholderia pseudomallei]ONC34738.1 hypothetical protein AQ916_15245 [Burkholderia pseudomallei]